MKDPPKIYCCYCRRLVKLIVGSVIYRCPLCDAIILPSQLAAALENDERGPNDEQSAGALPGEH